MQLSGRLGGWGDPRALRARPRRPTGCCRSRRPRSKRPGRQGASQRVRFSPLQIGNWKPVSGKLSLATLAEKLSGWSIGFRNEGLSRDPEGAPPRTLFSKNGWAVSAVRAGALTDQPSPDTVRTQPQTHRQCRPRHPGVPGGPLRSV
jgi:hypothetical protein